MEAMDRRQARIAARLEEADRKVAEAEAETRKYRQKQARLEKEREEVLDAAREEAADRRRELMDQARDEVEGIRAQWLESVSREKESFYRQLRERAGEEVYQVARKALHELAGIELEEHLVKVFLERLRQLDEEDRQNLARSIAESGRPIAVRTRFPLDGPIRQRIRDAVHAQIAPEVRVEFETAAGLIAGIELRADGLKVAWSLDEFLGSLRDELAGLLETEGMEGAEA